MLDKGKNASPGGLIILLLVMVSVLILKIGYINHYNWSPGLLIVLLLLLVAIVCVRRANK